MVKYIKCPRCDLNYIDSESQEYCDVCIAEMKGNKLQFADLDDEELDTIDAELETDEICPVCGIKPLRMGEKICESCRQQQEYEDDIDIDKDEEWKNYLDEDDEDLTVNDEELAEELEGEDDEEYEGEDDFFESEDVDSLDELEDDEFDDDEEDEDDDDDEDF